VPCQGQHASFSFHSNRSNNFRCCQVNSTRAIERTFIHWCVYHLSTRCSIDEHVNTIDRISHMSWDDDFPCWHGIFIARSKYTQRQSQSCDRRHEHVRDAIVRVILSMFESSHMITSYANHGCTWDRLVSTIMSNNQQYRLHVNNTISIGKNNETNLLVECHAMCRLLASSTYCCWQAIFSHVHVCDHWPY
jgi:hypothetical protein